MSIRDNMKAWRLKELREGMDGLGDLTDYELSGVWKIATDPDIQVALPHEREAIRAEMEKRGLKP